MSKELPTSNQRVPRPIEVLMNVAMMELPGIAEAINAQAQRAYDAAVAQDKEIERLTAENTAKDRHMADYHTLHDQLERLRAALTETETKLDEWYKLEARLHAAMHHFGGGEIIRKAIAAMGADMKAHNPRIAEAAPAIETSDGLR